jgi:hypothetical protein
MLLLTENQVAHTFSQLTLFAHGMVNNEIKSTTSVLIHILWKQQAYGLLLQQVCSYPLSVYVKLIGTLSTRGTPCDSVPDNVTMATRTM